MEVEHPRAGWEGSGQKWFRKTQLYTAVFDQDVDLDNYIVAGAPYAGAIALWRDDSKLQTFRPDRSKPSIDIHSLSGRLIHRIPWDAAKLGAIRGLGWSADEELLVVTADGTVRCYELQGEFRQFSLGHGADVHAVQSVRFHDAGLVALLGDNTLVAVGSYAEPRPRALAALPASVGDDATVVHSWAVVPPAQTLSRSVEVLLSIGRTVFVVDASACEDQGLDVGPFAHVSVSPDGRLVALYNSGRGSVYIVSADFADMVREADMDSRIEPRFVGWCGSADALVAWEDEVRVVGEGNVVFIYDCDRVHVVPELDGVRLITNDSCEFLEPVPRVTHDVFGHSTESSPASILLDAVAQLEMQSPKADDYIQLIRANLTEAVDTCVNAAGREFTVHWQKQLLKAASFGKSVLDLYNSDDFVDMCETLRVLNAARFFEVGMPLSYEQFQRLTSERLVRRLLNRHEYLLALRIAGYLRLPTDRIYVHWASAKVRAGATGDDDATCKAIVDKLSGRPGISFEEIARTAYDEGRARLATELLNHEPRGGRQVPLLLSMEEDELALDKAIESGDPDLTLTVLHKLRAKLPLAGFLRTASARPVASALVEAEAARTGDTALLKDLYYQDDRRADGASVFIRESLDQPDGRTAADKLALAHRLLSEAKERTLEAHALREASALLRAQEVLDRDLAEGFVGLSVNETMYRLVKLGYHGRAKKLQAEFRVPEPSAWWIRLRALVAKRDWNELEDLARARKSPIGWEPFFSAILAAGNPRLASVFVPKCAGLEPGEAVAMYEKCGMRVKAAEEAVRIKDAEAWERLLEAAGRNTADGVEIERLGKAVFGRK